MYLERRLVQVALVAYLAFEIPHFIYHLGADDALASGDRIASAVTLALTVVLAVGAVGADARATGRERRRGYVRVKRRPATGEASSSSLGRARAALPSFTGARVGSGSASPPFSFAACASI